MSSSSGTVSAVRWILGILAAVFVLWLIIFGIDWVSSRATPQAGQVGVVRNGPDAAWVGSWFNGHDIRGIVKPGSGSTYTGLGSSVHYYPTSSVQRQYTITSNAARGDRPGVDFVQVPTSDGVNVSLEGSFFFTTNFDASPQGKASVINFDNRFGVRQFPVAGTGEQLYPWQGTDGWEAFLDTVARPIIDNDLRKTIGSVSCQQLVSSCALVHQQTQAALNSANGTGNQQTIQRIQTAINNSLQQDIAATLGKDYFSNVQFLLARVTLPTAVQDQIDQAQAQFAAVGSAKAQVQQAQLTAQANKEKQQGYQNCPACATIDELKSIPQGVTTLALGGNTSLALK